jgi:hypothetical protein
MRRALIGLAVTAFTVLALAGPASAAPAQVMRFSFHGTVANAAWSTISAASLTDTSVHVSESLQGSVLSVEQFTANRDANGNFTGGTDTFTQVTGGFSFDIDQALLTSASLSGPGLPATACTLDADFRVIGCTATTIDMTLEWTGQGPISRTVSNDHFASDGFSETDHFNGTSRAATATGIIGGLALSASELEFANLVTENSETVTICIGADC